MVFSFSKDDQLALISRVTADHKYVCDDPFCIGYSTKLISTVSNQSLIAAIPLSPMDESLYARKRKQQEDEGMEDNLHTWKDKKLQDMTDEEKRDYSK